MSTVLTDKLMDARCRLMMREPWYGHIAMSMVWIPSQMQWIPEPQRTMGVRIVNAGEVQCIYYPPFVESLSITELYAIVQHEIEHIVRVHCLRIGDRDLMAWNIACDMTINGRKDNPRIGYPDPDTGKLMMPMADKIVWIPKDWAEDSTAEDFYELIMKNAKKVPVCGCCGQPQKSKSEDQEGNGQGQGEGEGEGEDQEGQGGGQGDQEGEGQGGGSCPKCGSEISNEYRYGQYGGTALDNHEVWQQSDVSEDEARQVIKDMTDQATQKCQGHAPGHLSEALKSLGKPVVRWRELLKHYLGRHVGNRRVTFSRRNRRHDNFGTPGISHHAAATVNVIVDTSGSVSGKELEQFFAEIDAISSKATTYILQWDHAFQGWQKYRRGDWKRFKVNGRGGTDMAAPMQWLMDNQKVADVQVMLTDGECNWKDAKEIGFPVITVITTDSDGPKYGHVVRMKVR